MCRQELPSDPMLSAAASQPWRIHRVPARRCGLTFQPHGCFMAMFQDIVCQVVRWETERWHTKLAPLAPSCHSC